MLLPGVSADMVQVGKIYHTAFNKPAGCKTRCQGGQVLVWKVQSIQ
jgi:hypothetical protein